jgi:hypothetical protein
MRSGHLRTPESAGQVVSRRVPFRSQADKCRFDSRHSLPAVSSELRSLIGHRRCLPAAVPWDACVPARCPIGQRSGRCWTVSVLAGPSCRARLRADGPAPLWHAGTPSRPAWRSGPSGSLARPALRLPHRSACCWYGEGHGHQGGTSARRRWPGTGVGLWPWGPADARRAVRCK